MNHIKAIEDAAREYRMANHLSKDAAFEALQAAIRAGVESAEPVAWKHDCAALLTNDVELWVDACPHCGKPRNTHPKPAAQEEWAAPAQQPWQYTPPAQERIDALELEVRQQSKEIAALRGGGVAILFEHEDGRYAVNPDTTDDPAWHRLGPVDVSALAFVPARPTSLDAYEGAREDLSICKRRALEAERDLRSEKEITSRLVGEMNAANGPAYMGEPAASQLAYGAIEYGWTDYRHLQDGDKRLMALVVGLYGNDHQSYSDLEGLLDRASRGQAPAHNIVSLSPLPSPAHNERVYGGHGNEIVHSYYTDHQMREYARQEVYRAEEAWQARASHGQAPAAQQAGEQPLPLLVRDIAADLATTPIQVCMALSTLGFGGHSVNMVITPTMAQALRAHFSATAQEDSQPTPLREGEWINDAGRIKWLLWRVQDLEAKLAARAPADSVTAPAGGVDDDVDAIALARYKVVPAHESMFHRFAVVAGGGKQQLYLGREFECENMARKFAGAFLDGAFYQSNIAPHSTRPGGRQRAGGCGACLSPAAAWAGHHPGG